MTGWTAKLGYAVAALTLMYFIVYAVACPSKELVAAVAMEVIVFILVIGFRSRKKNKHSREAQQAVLDELSTKSAITRHGWMFAKRTTVVALMLTILFMVFDFTALALTLSQQLEPAKQMYLINPVYRIPGVHPALSAELLAGAYMEADRLPHAEKLSEFLLDIRQSIYGEDHLLVADMYGNFARINLQKGDFKTAEKYCRQSIALSTKTSGYNHLGDGLTKLGNSLQGQKRYLEAETVYKEALAMREREFGTKSERVLKTLTDLEPCLRLQDKNTEADAVAVRIKDVQAFQDAQITTSNPWFLPLSVAISFGVSFILFGPGGVLTNLALRRIETRIKSAGDGADPKDIQKLISLYNHRKDKSKVEYYEALLSK
ncbi:MAG: tetratricopeptide repeat protein [Candidatus Melainabacteria bacterium]|nr:tetratricopeptide repeat protein [Candidatus Melainabacteria bacterium]